MRNMKKSKTCPLCNGKPFNQGDDFNTLCIEHATKVISQLLCHFAVEIIGSKSRKSNNSHPSIKNKGRTPLPDRGRSDRGV